MFCTGGIRCEKASAYLLSRGFAEVYHLKGGILKYLEGVPEAESRWRGECFVFDDRVALGHGLRERAMEAIPMSDVKTLSDRIDALETRLMFQDETIETLNQTITAQWRKIDALTRQVAALSERLQEAEANAPAPPTNRRRIISELGAALIAADATTGRETHAFIATRPSSRRSFHDDCGPHDRASRASSFRFAGIVRAERFRSIGRLQRGP